MRWSIAVHLLIKFLNTSVSDVGDCVLLSCVRAKWITSMIHFDHMESLHFCYFNFMKIDRFLGGRRKKIAYVAYQYHLFTVVNKFGVHKIASAAYLLCRSQSIHSALIPRASAMARAIYQRKTMKRAKIKTPAYHLILEGTFHFLSELYQHLCHVRLDSHDWHCVLELSIDARTK